MRLGEFFIHEGVIDTTQLQQALETQLMYGGHLGTCLLELGHAHEVQLGAALETIYRVPYATVEMFGAIPSSVIRRVPTGLAERHRAVPLAITGRTLRVALIDPSNLLAIDELAFASGCTIEPWVAPEARIVQAMERYYEIPRTQRFVAVCRQLDGEWINRDRSGGRGERRPRYELSPYLEAVRGTPTAKRPDVRSGTTPRKDRRAPKRRRASPAGASTQPHPPGGTPPAPPISWTALGAADSCNTGDETSEQLCRAESAEDVAEAILAYAVERMARCILFSVRSTEAVIWKARGVELDQERVRRLVFPVAAEPIFGLFLGDGHYRGPLPDDRRLRSFYDRIGVGMPSRLLVLPVYLDDRLVALFYGDGRRSDDIEGDTEHYKILLRKLALALDLVDLKRKIRAL